MPRMSCPVCRTSVLHTLTLPAGPEAAACDTCGGCWISASAYEVWRERSRGTAPGLFTADPGLPPRTEHRQPLQCPGCGYLLLPYAIGAAAGFRLDHCDHCNGIWVEAGEWALLQQQGVADKLPRVFTPAWQHEIRQADHRRRMDDIYARRFGAATYAELQRIRAWLHDTPDPSAALAYLTNPDPYGR